MKTILALIDFSDVSAKILDQAQALAQAFSGGVVLLHIVPPEPLVVDFEPPAVPPDVFQSRQQDLFALRRRLAAQDIQVTAQVVGGPLQETMMAQIDLFDPDVILMGSHGHGALYHLFAGSLTAAVIQHAGRPVLVIPSVPVPEMPQAVTLPIREIESTPLFGGLEGLPAPV
jgi:nucleotide-binding universal stress UspA family protein